MTKHNERVKDALRRMSSSNGNQKRRCFNQSRQEMIEVISKISPNAGILFEGTEQMIFEYASEIAHGSYFAFMEGFSGPTEGTLEKLEYNSELIFQTVILSAAAMGKAVACFIEDNQISDELWEKAESTLKSGSEGVI